MNSPLLDAFTHVQTMAMSYDGTLTEAAAPNIVGSVRKGVKDFATYVTGNGNLKLALQVLGGCIVFICIGLLAARKWWPNTPVGRSMQDQGGGKVLWTFAAIVLGVILIDPTDVAPFIAAIPTYILQIVLNVADNIFHFSTAA